MSEGGAGARRAVRLAVAGARWGVVVPDSRARRVRGGAVAVVSVERSAVTNWTHDATALAAAFVLFPPEKDPSGLLLAVLCVGSLGTWSAVARARQERAEKRVKERLAKLRERGVVDPQPTKAEYKAMRWRGPKRPLTMPLRVLSVLAAASASMPIAVALACARLPDQLEVGPIDHRKLTHYLVTATALIYGARYGLAQLVPKHLTAAQAELAVRGLATGFLTHLAMDGCTRSGVPLLWPFVRVAVHIVPKDVTVRGKKRKVAPRTGGPVDALVMLGALSGIVLGVSGS